MQWPHQGYHPVSCWCHEGSIREGTYGVELNEDMFIAVHDIGEVRVGKDLDVAGNFTLGLGLDAGLLGDEGLEGTEVALGVVGSGIRALAVEVLKRGVALDAETLAELLVGCGGQLSPPAERHSSGHTITVNLRNRHLILLVGEGGSELFVDGGEFLAVWETLGDGVDGGAREDVRPHQGCEAR